MKLINADQHEIIGAFGVVYVKCHHSGDNHVRDAADAGSKRGKRGRKRLLLLCLLVRTYQNSIVCSRVDWWIAVKLYLMTICILVVVLSVLFQKLFYF